MLSLLFLGFYTGTQLDLQLPQKPVEQTISQNLWVQMNGWIKTAQSAVSKNPRFFLAILENATLVVREREHFRGFLADFFVAELPQKRGVLFHRNSLASCQLLSSECRRQIKTSLVVVMLLLRVMTYVIFYELFWNWIDVVPFVSHEVWPDKGFVIWHFLRWCF